MFVISASDALIPNIKQRIVITYAAEAGNLRQKHSLMCIKGMKLSMQLPNRPTSNSNNNSNVPPELDRSHNFYSDALKWNSPSPLLRQTRKNQLVPTRTFLTMVLVDSITQYMLL